MFNLLRVGLSVGCTFALKKVSFLFISLDKRPKGEAFAPYKNRKILIQMLESCPRKH